jgi:hypothetical protein
MGLMGIHEGPNGDRRECHVDAMVVPKGSKWFTVRDAREFHGDAKCPQYVQWCTQGSSEGSRGDQGVRLGINVIVMMVSKVSKWYSGAPQRDHGMSHGGPKGVHRVPREFPS